MASTLSQILPLLILILVVAGISFVLYHIWQTWMQFGKNTSDRMAKKNVIFTKDGMRVGVKQASQEQYIDATQSWVVKAWNLGTATPDAVKRK